MASFDAERMRHARLDAGLSQAKLAAAVGVAGQVIGRWERGDTQPSSQDLQHLAYALDVNVSSLLRRSGVHGPTVVALRESTGLSQRDVARAAGVSITAYRQFERGWVDDDLLVRKIAVALGYPAPIVQAAVDDDREQLRDQE